MPTIAISLPGVRNARVAADVEGAWLLRSGSLDELGRGGALTLRRLGVTRVIDLREPGERRPARHGIEVVEVPLYDRPEGVPTTGELEAVYGFLIRERGHRLAAAVAAIAETEGRVLVHCAVGKDRTGLVVALALLAAGVSEDDVVGDYAVSAAGLADLRAAVEERLAPLGLSGAERTAALRLHLESPTGALTAVLGGLGGAAGVIRYLREHGASIEQLELLRARLAPPTALRAALEERVG